MKTRELRFGAPWAADRLTHRLDVLITVLGILGLVLFLGFYDQAFPSAALELELSREQIARRTTDYIESLGHNLSEYEFALTFDEAWAASVYLQHTLGIPETNNLAHEEDLPLWLWRARWFKPLQKEGFFLSLMPDGKVVALTHSVLEDAPGADIPQDEARALAEAYLTEDRGWNLSDWEEVTASTDAMPGGRSDHHFEWKRSDWDVGKSELCLAVDIQGDSIGGYGYWLEVPEGFLRHFSEQRNRAGFINNISYYLSVGLFGFVTLIYYLLGHRRGVFPWHEGMAVGLAVAGVSLLDDLNWLPLSKAWYGTTQDYTMFWVNRLIGIFTSFGFVAVEFMVLWAGGRYLARKIWPRQDKVLPRSGDVWVALSRSTWRGLMVAGLGGGYVVLFYLIATQFFGGWTPMGSPDVNLYATPLPFVAPLANGVLPAVNEEVLVRLVGIGVVLGITRKRWLAVFVPGVLWAFAHLSYVRDPIYLRGVELTIKALLYGLIFLRFDLTTTIVAHLAYNAGLTALPLLRSGQPYFVANGVLVIVGLVVPIIPGGVRMLRQRLGGMPATSPPTIRLATEEDVPRLSELGDDGVDWAAWIEDPSATVLCMWARDRLAGVAVGRVESGDVGQVSILFLAPEWRRRYWGSGLAVTLSEALQERGAHSLQVTVPAGNWPLARFWDTQGWKPSATTYAHASDPSLKSELSAVMDRVKHGVSLVLKGLRVKR